MKKKIDQARQGLGTTPNVWTLESAFSEKDIYENTSGTLNRVRKRTNKILGGWQWDQKFPQAITLT